MKLETEEMIKRTSKVRAALVAERADYVENAKMHALNAWAYAADVKKAVIKDDFGITPLDAIHSLTQLQVNLGRIRAMDTAIEMIDLAGLE